MINEHTTKVFFLLVLFFASCNLYNADKETEITFDRGNSLSKSKLSYKESTNYKVSVYNNPFLLSNEDSVQLFFSEKLVYNGYFNDTLYLQVPINLDKKYVRIGMSFKKKNTVYSEFSKESMFYVDIKLGKAKLEFLPKKQRGMKVKIDNLKYEE